MYNELYAASNRHCSIFSHVPYKMAVEYSGPLNVLRPRQDSYQFPGNICKCIFLNENILILIEISLKLDHKGPINNIPVMVQIMAWHWPGDKPSSELMLVSLLMHICVTQPH